MTASIINDENKTSRGDFFQIDSRSWAHVTQLNMNSAVAYLVLARGTGPDNRTTCWSVHSIETYTGISRGRAIHAIKTLLSDGAVKLIRGGTKPKYELLPWVELNKRHVPERKPMSKRQRKIFESIRAGKQPRGSDAKVAARMVNVDRLCRDTMGLYAVLPEPKPDWIWLPNELVTGAANETPPVELVRQTQDVMTLRLLVDFYYAQNLCEDGGIGRQFTGEKYERSDVGQQAQFTVWGFSYNTTYVVWDGPSICHRRDNLTKKEKSEGKKSGVDYFRRLGQLADLGLIEWVPHLIESDDPDAEIIHAVGECGSQSIEDRLGIAAYNAGVAMLTEGQLEWADENVTQLVPVPHHIANVQMIGIARLRYRPKTRLTAAWFAELQTKGEKYIEIYSELANARAKKAVNF